MTDMIETLRRLLGDLPGGAMQWHPELPESSREGSIFCMPREGIAIALAMRPRYTSAEDWARTASAIVAMHSALPHLLACAEALESIKNCRNPERCRSCSNIAAAALAALKGAA